MDRPWDIIDEIQANVGKIRSKKFSRRSEEGFYDSAYQEANRGAGAQLFSSHGQSPDSAVDALRRAGNLGQDASVDDLWEAIAHASGAMRHAGRYDAPEKHSSQFTQALTKKPKGSCQAELCCCATGRDLPALENSQQ